MFLSSVASGQAQTTLHDSYRHCPVRLMQPFAGKVQCQQGTGIVSLQAVSQNVHLHWNAEHQLAEAVSRRNGTEQRTRYGYDAFGRRSWKQDAFGVTHFIWDGNRLLSEERGNQQHIWIYEDEGLVPLAQISTRRGESEHDAQVYWYHTDQAGLPRELTGVTGDIAWRADYRAWGSTLWVETAEQAEPVHQPLRFQGQYYDAETGLHYNRFRYYASGCRAVCQPGSDRSGGRDKPVPVCA